MKLLHLLRMEEQYLASCALLQEGEGVGVGVGVGVSPGRRCTQRHSGGVDMCLCVCVEMMFFFNYCCCCCCFVLFCSTASYDFVLAFFVCFFSCSLLLFLVLSCVSFS